MHRFLTDCPSDMTVDHLNYKTLDNRKINLEVKTDLENNRNRKNKANNNSITGVRNVTYDKKSNKYIVQFWINNKNVAMGKFDKLEQAKNFANAVRHNKDTVSKILVHCDAGISRSAGVAAATMKYITGDDWPIWNSSLYCPNMRCYRFMLEEFFNEFDEEEALKRSYANMKTYRESYL